MEQSTHFLPDQSVTFMKQLINLFSNPAFVRSVTELSINELKQMSAHDIAVRLLETEEAYVSRVLRPLVETFKARLISQERTRLQPLKENEIQAVFLNIDQIYEFHVAFQQDLRSLAYSNSLVSGLGSTLISLLPYFKIYLFYIQNFDDAKKKLKHLLLQKKKFSTWIEREEFITGSNMTTLLEAPIARLPQYVVYLGGILIALPKDHKERSGILDALERVQGVTKAIAEQIKHQHSRNVVVELQLNTFKNRVRLVDTARYYRTGGFLEHIRPKKTFQFSNVDRVLLFLFNDILLWCNKSRRPLYVISVHTLQIRERDGDCTFDLMRGSDTYTLKCKDEASRHEWVGTFKMAIEEARVVADGLKPIDEQLLEDVVLGKKDNSRPVYIPKAYMTPRGHAIQCTGEFDDEDTSLDWEVAAREFVESLPITRTPTRREFREHSEPTMSSRTGSTRLTSSNILLPVDVRLSPPPFNPETTCSTHENDTMRPPPFDNHSLPPMKVDLLAEIRSGRVLNPIRHSMAIDINVRESILEKPSLHEELQEQLQVFRKFVASSIDYEPDNEGEW